MIRIMEEGSCNLKHFWLLHSRLQFHSKECGHFLCLNVRLWRDVFYLLDGCVFQHRDHEIPSPLRCFREGWFWIQEFLNKCVVKALILAS